ncbi:MAG TPA: hypothetical protein VK357_11225 [Rubrobacteraceae bacterium]|jgi:hypothetical protein|nr:hypothetical protein [Rubrobacteraceae bacterium]
MVRAALFAAVMLIAVLSIAACGGSQISTFNATTLEGDEFRLTDKRDEVVALYFMAGY